MMATSNEHVTLPSESVGQTSLFQQLSEYPFDTDEEFQGGLRAILGSVQDPAQVSHLTLRAKCYYFARKAGIQIDFNAYKAWVEAQQRPDNSGASTLVGNSMNGTLHDDAETTATNDSSEGAGSGGVGDAPKPASFAEICEMIAEGKPIPGIKDIPDTILEGQASESRVTRRKKPWEIDENSSLSQKPALSWMAASSSS